MSRTREKKCPSCQTPVNLLQLSAIPFPVEQVTMPWLRIMNKQAGNSVRTFSMSGINEQQFLAFTCICDECGHISWWDLETEELETIITSKHPTIKLRWGSNPELLKKIIGALEDIKMKAPFERLLDDLSKFEDNKNA